MARPAPIPPRQDAPAFPDWARGSAWENGADAAFAAGAALGALHGLARFDAPPSALWRQRLGMDCALASVRQLGRTEDIAELRDQWCLTRAGDDPGPAGRMLAAWRMLAERRALTLSRFDELCALMQLRPDDALRDALEAVEVRAAARGAAIFAAADVAALVIQARPDARPLGLWLADAVLARRLKWAAPVPLLGVHLKRADFRAVGDKTGDADAWRVAVCAAYAQGAAAAFDLHGELSRRAARLLDVAPKLRGKDAAATVAALMAEDALAPRAGAKSSDRSSRRLFERLVQLGAVRELTGRATFRLYGL